MTSDTLWPIVVLGQTSENLLRRNQRRPCTRFKPWKTFSFELKPCKHVLTAIPRQKYCEILLGSLTFIISKLYLTEHRKKTVLAPGGMPHGDPVNKPRLEPGVVSHRRRVTAVCRIRKRYPEGIQAVSRREHPTPGSGFGIQIGPKWELIARYPKSGSQPDLLNFQLPVRGRTFPTFDTCKRSCTHLASHVTFVGELGR